MGRKSQRATETKRNLPDMVDIHFTTHWTVLAFIGTCFSIGATVIVLAVVVVTSSIAKPIYPVKEVPK